MANRMRTIMITLSVVALSVLCMTSYVVHVAELAIHSAHAEDGTPLAIRY